MGFVPGLREGRYTTKHVLYMITWMVYKHIYAKYGGEIAKWQRRCRTSCRTLKYEKARSSGSPIYLIFPVTIIFSGA